MKILFSTFVFCMLAVVCAGKEVVWKTGGGLENWKALYRLKCVPAKEGLRLTSIGNDSAIRCGNLQLDPQRLNVVEITYRARGIRSRTHGQIYYENTLGRFSDARRWNLPSMIGNGEWQTMRVTSESLTEPASWFKGGTVTQLRIDMQDEPGGEIEIAKIRFFHDPNVRPAKSMTEQLDGPV